MSPLVSPEANVNQGDNLRGWFFCLFFFVWELLSLSFLKIPHENIKHGGTFTIPLILFGQRTFGSQSNPRELDGYLNFSRELLGGTRQAAQQSNETFYSNSSKLLVSF